MFFVLISLWLVAIIILLSNPRKPSTRWLSVVAFCGGCGGLAAVVGDQIIPFAIEHQWNEYIQKLLEGLRKSSSLMQYYGTPYSYFMFALSYHPMRIERIWYRRLAYVLLLPAIVSILFVKPFYPIHYPITSMWAIPYIVLGTLLIVSKKERNDSLRRMHYLTMLAVVPTVFYAGVMNYVLPSFGYFEMWRYNTWVIIYGVLVFFYAIFTFGFLGVQLHIQRRQLDYTIRAITSGTAILNHAIKNDVGKMKLFGEKIRSYAEQSDQKELVADIQVILSSSRHIQEMIARVHEQTQDLALKKDMYNAVEMVQQVLDQLQPQLTHIQTKVSYLMMDGSLQVGELSDWELWCDREQVIETLSNVIVNAIEAMSDGGELLVKLSLTKKYITIEIKDTGHGMEKDQLKQAIEPFYTTKGSSNLNFGLGLAYCYHVMQKHGGSLEIDSKLGIGTTVALNFPKKR